MNDEFLEKQYKLAIDAREKLVDNYHKWMTFYYVANSAVLIAITYLFNKTGSYNNGILALALLGLLVSMLWNLSCKGYYYWSGSWINIIIKLEKKLIKGKTKYGVFSVFSQDIVNNEKDSWMPMRPANISTPKLTMLFSFISIIAWLVYSIYLFWEIYSTLTPLERTLACVLFLLIILIVYLIVIPKLAKSRINLHSLV